MSEENATYSIPIKIVSECPMKRYFLITVISSGNYHYDFEIVTDGVFPSRKLILECADKKHGISVFAIVNIFEFHNQQDYYNFLNIV